MTAPAASPGDLDVLAYLAVWPDAANARLHDPEYAALCHALRRAPGDDPALALDQALPAAQARMQHRAAVMRALAERWPLSTVLSRPTVDG